MKLQLTAMMLRATIEPDNELEKSYKVTAMIFIRRHMHDALQMEYLTEEDPRAPWIVLEECFDHRR